MSNLIGQTLLNQFRVESFIASGGMGAVYRVTDLKRNVPLAMKVLHADLSEDPTAFKSFQREARALQRLAHPNIVPFYGSYQTSEFVFLLELYVDGLNLMDIMRRQKGPLPLEDALVFLNAVCSALGYAHANGVVHCDVKPGNVMIDRGGQIYLTDFGIARHAESATTTLGGAGTPAYMAPEQIRGEPVVPATDIYALGVLAFEMLTGRRPFRGESASASDAGATVAERIRFEQLRLPPPNPREINPAIPEAVAGVILKALQKSPEKRFATTHDFFSALCAAGGVAPEQVAHQVKTRQPVGAKQPPPGAMQAPAQRSSKSRAWVWWLGGIVALACLAFLVVLAQFSKGVFTSPTSTPRQQQESSPTAAGVATRHPAPTSAPTKKPRLTPSPSPVYDCPDKNQVNLKVGIWGRVKINKIPLLAEPALPGDSNYQQIRLLQVKEKIKVLDGPKCFNGVTWWKIITESSDIGWSQEFDLRRGYLLVTP